MKKADLEVQMERVRNLEGKERRKLVDKLISTLVDNYSGLDAPSREAFKHLFTLRQNEGAGE